MLSKKKSSQLLVKKKLRLNCFKLTQNCKLKLLQLITLTFKKQFKLKRKKRVKQQQKLSKKK